MPIFFLFCRMMMGRGPGRAGARSLGAREREGERGAGAGPLKAVAFSLGAGERAGVLSLWSSRGAMGAGRGRAGPSSASISGSRRPGSIRASLLLSSLRRAPGPRLLILLGAGPGAGAGVGLGVGAGAGAAAVGGVGGFRVPELFLS